eukprot:scaffold171102_cov17-Tisochrysis_lutea.AAC.1
MKEITPFNYKGCATKELERQARAQNRSSEQTTLKDFIMKESGACLLQRLIMSESEAPQNEGS